MCLCDYRFLGSGVIRICKDVYLFIWAPSMGTSNMIYVKVNLFVTPNTCIVYIFVSLVIRKT